MQTGGVSDHRFARAPAHVLLAPRHAGRGAAPKAIQELVGHSTLSMTLRYMHLAPSALCEAIGLLNFGQPMGSAEAAAV
jgi:site-specific recombinase XerD